MKRLLLLNITLLTLCLNCVAEAEWLDDVPVALDKAKAENKFVLLDFTGSDWCGWCKRLKSEVFDQPEFASYAQANLILVELDYPHHKYQSNNLRAANEELLRNYHINGFPSIVLLNSSGKEIGRTGYMPGGPGPFTAKLSEITGLTSGPIATDSRPAVPAPRPPPAFVPIPPAVPNHYGELALKAISDAKDHRLALINDQTFAVGETAKAKVHDGRVEITCQEIRADSVIILVDGKVKELVIGQH